MQGAEEFRKIIEKQLNDLDFPLEPVRLYDPIRYTLSLGGKRLRPVLVLMGAELAGGDVRTAINPALGIELFHNFTLLHDDIMDNAPLRRGKQTVFKKWSSNIAILSGDVMFTKASGLISDAPINCLKQVLEVFYKTAAEVCEGQQMDMDYEDRDDVSVSEYMEMIRKKTAVLLGASLQIGALCGGADTAEAERLYTAGFHFGLAFQLQDDLLDVFGDPDVFGKQQGGDIISDKKTFLRLRALEIADENKKESLKNSFIIKSETDKVNSVTNLFNELGIKEETFREIKRQLHLGEEALKETGFEEDKLHALKALTAGLLMRTT